MNSPRDLSPDIVLNTYTSCDEEDIKYVFTHDEITEMKASFFQVASQKSLKEELIKAFKIVLDADSEDYLCAIQELLRPIEGRMGDRGIKNLAIDYRELITKITKGYEIRKGLVYTLEDLENGVHVFYDDRGKFLGERRIAGRLQLNLLSIKKEANNE